MYRQHIKKICFSKAICLITMVLFLGIMVNPSTIRAEAESALLEKAKAEGKVVWYVSVELPVAQAVAKGFEKKYNIKVEVFRTNSAAQLTRVLSEFNMKRYIPDVISMNVLNTHLVKSKGILGQYFSHETKNYPKGFYDPEGYWVSDHFNGYVVAYNTKLIPPAEVPKTWEDLLQPRFRGKIMADSTKAQWFIAQLDRMGEEKGLAYMNRLGAQKVVARRGLTQIAQLLAAGESSLGLFANLARVEEFRDRGASIKAAPIQPLIASIDCSAIASHAPRPNAAKLFIDYILTREAQIAMGEENALPSLPKTPHSAASLLDTYEIFPTSPVSPEVYSKMFDLYRKTFNF